MFNFHSAKDILRRIESTFEAILNEQDEEVRRGYMIRLAELKDAVNTLDQENQKFFSKVFHGVIRDKYGGLYEELRKLWASYKRDSEKARLRKEETSNTDHRRATESSPSLGLYPHQELQGHGSQTASRSTAVVHNVPTTSSSSWATRIFPRRDPTSDRRTYQSASSSVPSPNMAPSAEQQQGRVSSSGHLYQPHRGAPAREGSINPFASPFAYPNALGPNMAPSAEQQQAHIPGNNWGGQQYHQPEHGASTTDRRTHQFASPNVPGLNMAPSAEQRHVLSSATQQAHLGGYILSPQQQSAVDRQVDEDWMRRPVVAQGMGQYPQSSVLPQGQFSLPLPP